MMTGSGGLRASQTATYVTYGFLLKCSKAIPVPIQLIGVCTCYPWSPLCCFAGADRVSMRAGISSGGGQMGSQQQPFQALLIRLPSPCDYGGCCHEHCESHPLVVTCETCWQPIMDEQNLQANCWPAEDTVGTKNLQVAASS